MTKSAPVATQGYYYPLVGKKFWVVGSSPDCHIVFSNDYISSHHALLLATADRAIYFCDLQSVNGSFVNEEQVFVPTLLKHGDLLRIGPLEIEFQHTSEFPVGHTPVPARVVLLLQPSEAQAAIWSAILKACNIAVIYESKAPQESEQFAAFIPTLEKLPDLLLADMETLKPNPYAFCRWCHNQYPSLKIILTCSNRTEIFESEKRWVAQQGAVDLLAGFSRESFFSESITDVVERLQCVLNALDISTAHLPSLEPILRSLRLHFTSKEVTSETPSDANLPPE